MFKVTVLCALASSFLAVPQASALNVLLSNDDGWAGAQIRAQFNAIESAGMTVVLSAPAENQSGTGSQTIGTTSPPAMTEACEFDSCPAGSPGIGHDASNPRLNWVNGFPVDSVKIGVETIAQPFFTKPDIVISGPNTGANTEFSVLGSGTVGGACEGAQEGFPAIAFSGQSAASVSFTTLETDPNSPATQAALIYAQRSVDLINVLVASGSSPLIPSGTILNVNYPKINATNSCTQPGDIKFVLTRVFPPIPIITPKDVTTCGNGGRLPAEDDVAMDPTGCFASVSVVDAELKLDVLKDRQTAVLSALSPILSCFSD